MDRDALQPQEHVPAGVRIAAAWAWRLAVLGFVGYWAVQLLAVVQVLVVPLLLAVLLAALLLPVVDAARRAGAGAFGTSIGVVLLLLLALVSVVGLVGAQIATGLGDLSVQVADGVGEVRDWLVRGPLPISTAQLAVAVERVQAAVVEGQQGLVSGALSVTATAGEVLAGTALALFACVFYLAEGDRLWGWSVGLLPRAARPGLDLAGRRAWVTLTAYVRATVVVAFVDALGIGLGAALLQVPLALPLAVLVFLGAFVPIVGALLTGGVAVLVALVANGPVTALLMLVVVIGVQQAESTLLQPLLLGRAVHVHPLAVVVSITGGVLLAGVVGALLAVPVVAVANTVVLSLAGRADEDDGLAEAARAPVGDVPQPSSRPDRRADEPVPGRRG